jgi:hypothetical protein
MLLSYSDASVFVWIYARYDIWEKLFHRCIHVTKRERERGTHASHEYAHQRATRAAARNKRYRFARERERERERITLSERACDDDDDAKCIRVRSSMRFDDLFVGEAEGNNIDENENESY